MCSRAVRTHTARTLGAGRRRVQLYSHTWAFEWRVAVVRTVQTDRRHWLTRDGESTMANVRWNDLQMIPSNLFGVALNNRWRVVSALYCECFVWKMTSFVNYHFFKLPINDIWWKQLICIATSYIRWLYGVTVRCRRKGGFSQWKLKISGLICRHSVVWFLLFITFAVATESEERLWFAFCARRIFPCLHKNTTDSLGSRRTFSLARVRLCVCETMAMTLVLTDTVADNIVSATLQSTWGDRLISLASLICSNATNSLV